MSRCKRLSRDPHLISNYIAAYLNGEKTKDICIKFNITPGYLYLLLAENDIPTNRQKQNTQTKFNENIEKTDHCWLWIGALNQYGYGRFAINRKNKLAHRLSYEMHIGAIPEGLLVCHKCDVRNCVNPSHLFLGTYQDNATDMVNKRRQSFGERHPGAKLNMQEVLFIRESKASTKYLMGRFDIGESGISHIKKRRNWKYIDGEI